MTQIMDDIDATRADIALTEDNLARVERVHLAVGRHANQVAQARALDYRERDAVVGAVSERLVEARERAATQREELGAARTRLRDADRERADLRGRLKVLRNHEAYRSRDALASAEQEVARAREHLARVEAEVRDAARAVTDLEKERSRLRERWTDQHDAASREVAALAEAAQGAAWPQAEQRAEEVGARLKTLELGAGEPPELQADALAELAGDRGRRLEEVVQALAGVSVAEGEVERADSVVDEARTALREGHDDLRLAREATDTCRDDLGVRLERWQGGLRELPIRASDVAELREATHRLEDGAAVGPALFEPWLERAARRRSELDSDRDVARSKLGAVEARLRATREELRAWEGREEALPEPRPGQTEARASLAAEGVAAVPLFRAVEVRSFVPEPEVRLLHAALRESGLLDALVVRAEDVEAVAATLGDEGGDRWIRPAPLPEGRATLADVLEPTSCGVEESVVLFALRSIGLERLGAEPTAGVATDGTWTAGVLEGRATGRTAEGPVYLGRGARVRARDERVSRLRADLSELDDEANRERDEIRGLGERLATLDAEVDELRVLPEVGALSSALAIQAERARRVQGLNARLQEAEAETAGARRAVGRARQLLEVALRNAPDARGRDTDGVRELVRSTERVVTSAERAADRLEALRERGEEVRRAETDIERRRSVLAEARTRAERADEVVAETEGRARIIETELAGLGYHEIVAEVEKAEKRQDDLELEGRELAETIGGLEISLEHADAEVTRLGTERAGAERERTQARARLAEAVHAYPTLEEAAALFGDGTEGSAARTADHLLERREERSTDLARRIEDDQRRAQQGLFVEVTESRSALVEYQPSLDPDTGVVSFRHEGRELPPHALLKVLARHRQGQENAMRDKEDELYEEFFLQEVSGRIREAIERAEESVDRVNDLLAERPLANDEILTLRWRPRKEIGADGADHPRLVELLKKPASVLPAEDVRWIKSFFRERVRMVREGAARGRVAPAEEETSFGEALRAVLDYRRWFSFTLHGKRPGEALTEITNREFATRSGGEKSLAMFVPLLAALDARFRSARPDAPKLVGLDEAFAGVDSNNINEMFAFMVGLDLSWIMTSERLFGVGAALPACTTYQFHRRGTVAAVQPWLWDGRRNAAEDTLELVAESGDAEELEGSGAA
ncbi:MAG: SbcC/MukB-like Walker B domain-containing protein [Gemmatimonadota bacterium]